MAKNYFNVKDSASTGCFRLDDLKLKVAALLATEVVCWEVLGSLLTTGVDTLVCIVAGAVVAGVLAIAGNFPVDKEDPDDP